MTDSEDPNQIECPRCGAQLSLTWSRCPECGLPLYPEEDADGARQIPGRSSATFGWLTQRLITFLVVGGLLGGLTGLTFGLNWIWMMLVGLLLFCLGWATWNWLNHRKINKKHTT